VPEPVLEISSTEVMGNGFVRYYLTVKNYQAFPVAMFDSAPGLPPCGLNTNSSRTWVNIYNADTDSYLNGFCAMGSPTGLTQIWFAAAADAPGLRLCRSRRSSRIGQLSVEFRGHPLNVDCSSGALRNQNVPAIFRLYPVATLTIPSGSSGPFSRLDRSLRPISSFKPLSIARKGSSHGP
jgi:hypothetical protein